MQTVLQHWTYLRPEQRGKCIQFIKRRRKAAARLHIICFKWTRRVGHGGENESGAPIVGETYIQFRPWPQRRSRGSESHQDIFAPVTQNCAISECQRATLIKTDTSEGRTDGSELSFAKDQSRMWTGTEGSCWQPHRGDAAGRGIAVIVHLAGQDHSARAAQLLVVCHSRCG